MSRQRISWWHQDGVPCRAIRSEDAMRQEGEFGKEDHGTVKDSEAKGTDLAIGML